MVDIRCVYILITAVNARASVCSIRTLISEYQVSNIVTTECCDIDVEVHTYISS